MTGPEGDQPHGWWWVLSADPPRSLEVEDGFGDAEGNPNPAMQQLLAMGMEEGIGATDPT